MLSNIEFFIVIQDILQENTQFTFKTKTKQNTSWWQRKTLIAMLGRQKQSNLNEFQASLVYIVRPCLDEKKSSKNSWKY